MFWPDSDSTVHDVSHKPLRLSHSKHTWQNYLYMETVRDGVQAYEPDRPLNVLDAGILNVACYAECRLPSCLHSSCSWQWMGVVNTSKTIEYCRVPSDLNEQLWSWNFTGGRRTAILKYLVSLMLDSLTWKCDYNTTTENFGNSGKTFCTREWKFRAGLVFPGATPRLTAHPVCLKELLHDLVILLVCWSTLMDWY